MSSAEILTPEIRAYSRRDLDWHRAQAAEMRPARLRRAFARRQMRGDARAALEYGTTLFELAPKADLALALARLHRQCRSFDAGRRLLARAPGPEDPALLRAQAELAGLAREYRIAAGLWQRVLEASPTPGPYAVLQAIGCLRQCGDEEEARALVAEREPLLRGSYPAEAVVRLGTGLQGLPDPPVPLGMLTGNNGTGKTTVGHMLQAIGFRVIDADTEIAGFLRKGVYSPVRYDLTRGDPRADAQVAWRWVPEQFDAACAAAQAAGRPAVVIGGFGKAVAPYVGAVARVVHLTAPDAVVARRLARRGSPAHHPGTRGHAAALARNSRLLVPDYPAICLRADRPVWPVCRDVLKALATG